MSEFKTGPGPSHSPKHELIAGIRQWVAEKLGREQVSLSSMHAMKWEEILLIAGAMGYRPRSETERKVLRNTLDAKRIDQPLIEK